MAKGGQIKDLTGKTFGYWKVISFQYLQTKQGAVWKCECICGRIKEKLGNNLLQGKTKSCGCKKSELIQRKIRSRIPNDQAVKNDAYRGHCALAKKRGLISYLSKEEYLQIVSKPCEYCGQFYERMNRATGKYYPLNTVDRRDNEPYYKVKNSVSACLICNRVKKGLRYDEFIDKMKSVCRHLFSID